MLLAPLLPMSLTHGSVRAPARQRSRRGVDPALQASRRRRLLVGWALLGSLAVLCIPALRGGPTSGWTLPFWLVAAPLINLGAMTWLQRRDARKPRRR